MRYFYNSKATADESCKLRISELRKLGMLTGEEAFEIITWTSNRPVKKIIVGVAVNITDDPYVRLVYSVTDREGKRTDYDYEVSFVTTLCNFGGVRYWFVCPDCWSRVGVLYLVPGDVRFRCRYCNNLSYHSRNRCRLGTFGHTSRQIDKLRSEIKRWTWRGRPTRKVKRLHALEQKVAVLGTHEQARMEKFRARLRKHK